MSEVIVYVQDNLVYVVHPATSVASAMKDIPSGVASFVIDKSQLPKRRFRNAWEVVSNSVTVNLQKAREQVLAEVRLERDKRLKDSDSDKQRLDDIGSPQDKVKLAQYRQQLRDFPAVVASQIAALGLTDLENYTPTYPALPI